MLTYDEFGHAFWNGERVPRTTEICSLLAPRWQADEYYLHKGILIHRVIEWEETGELDESSVDPALIGYLRAYREFKWATAWNPRHTETPFVHQKYRYCGRVDQTGVFGLHHWRWVIDFKSGQPHEADLLQSPAYLFGLKSNGMTIERCGDLYLKDNGNYRFVEVRNPTDRFLKFLTGLKQWRENNGSGNGNRE
jgi:hypothetical protein